MAKEIDRAYHGAIHAQKKWRRGPQASTLALKTQLEKLSTRANFAYYIVSPCAKTENTWRLENKSIKIGAKGFYKNKCCLFCNLKNSSNNDICAMWDFFRVWKMMEGQLFGYFSFSRCYLKKLFMLNWNTNVKMYFKLNFTHRHSSNRQFVRKC